MWNFKGTLWNSTQHILFIHWKMWILFTTENLRALRFKSSKLFLKRPPSSLFEAESYVFWHLHVWSDCIINIVVPIAIFYQHTENNNTVQYISRIMNTVFVALVSRYMNCYQWINVSHIPIFFRVALRALVFIAPVKSSWMLWVKEPDTEHK